MRNDQIFTVLSLLHVAKILPEGCLVKNGANTTNCEKGFSKIKIKIESTVVLSSSTPQVNSSNFTKKQPRSYLNVHLHCRLISRIPSLEIDPYFDKRVLEIVNYYLFLFALSFVCQNRSS